MTLVESINQELNLDFSNQELIQTAFTHRSYLNEHPKYTNPSNERLEFLGDAILQFLSSKHLYNKFSELPEGDLTNLRASIVKTTSLAEEAKKLNFGNHLLLSKGEESTGGREREYLLANTFEAFLGALFLEKGIEACDEFLNTYLFYKLEDSVNSKNYKDPKTRFQEKVQETKKTTPTYKIIDSWGSEHEKTFKVGVYISGELFTEGEGSSKQKAEQDAAMKGLDKLK
jgi:ribonuclease-3